MKSNNYSRSKKINSFLLLTIIFLEFCSLAYLVLAKPQNVSGYSKRDEIKPGESKSYEFSGNILFDISTNVPLNLDVEYDKNIKDREISIDINNQDNDSISFGISSKTNMNSFGFSSDPKEPKGGNYRYQWQYSYGCIYRIKANHTIDELTLNFKKSDEYGLNPANEYSIVLLDSDQESWEVIDTEEMEPQAASDGTDIEGTLTDLEPDVEYFITIYQKNDLSSLWIVIALAIAIGVVSIVVILSKKDYIHFLKTRTVPLESGAHRLTLDEVLENENRDKIIDIILKEPGIHFNELLRRTELAAGNLVWHLDVLETYKVIGKKRIGNFIAYFLYYDKNPISNIDFKLSKSKFTLEVLEIIEKEPGLWNNVITKRKKVDHKTIQYHIDKLVELGLVQIKKVGRKNQLFPNLQSEYFLNKTNGKDSNILK